MIAMLRKFVQSIARKKEPVTDRSEFLRGWMDAARWLYGNQLPDNTVDQVRRAANIEYHKRGENVAWGNGWDLFLAEALDELRRPNYFPFADEYNAWYSKRLADARTARRTAVANEVTLERSVEASVHRQGVLSIEDLRANRRREEEAEVASAREEDAEDRGFQHAMGIYTMNRQHKTYKEIQGLVDRSASYPWTWEPNQRLLPFWLAGLDRGWTELQRIYRASPHLYVHDYRERQDTPEPTGRQGAARRTTLRDT